MPRTAVPNTESQIEPVACVAVKHAQVNGKDVLRLRLPVNQEGIHPLTPHASAGTLAAASSSRYSTEGMKNMLPKPTMVHTPVIR